MKRKTSFKSLLFSVSKTSEIYPFGKLLKKTEKHEKK